jgi:hypothetical protein
VYDSGAMSVLSSLVTAAKRDLGMTPEGRERKAREVAERRTRVEHDRARQDSTFAGVCLSGESIESPDGGGNIRGARAIVDSAGSLTQRVTATRVLLAGPLAFGMPKRVDHRELFLIIEGVGWGLSVEVPPNLGAQARNFAVKVNAAATALEAS